MTNSGTSPYSQDGPGHHSNPAGSSPYGAPQGSAQPPGALPLAEWWQRLVARIIDGVILGIVTAILSMILTPILGSSVFLASLLTAVLGAAIYFAYEFFMLRSGGQTVGKKVMGLRVVSAPANHAAEPLSSNAVLTRAGVLWGPLAINFIPVIGFIAYLFYVVNVLWQFWDKPLHQCLHDKLAGTVVVKVK